MPMRPNNHGMHKTSLLIYLLLPLFSIFHLRHDGFWILCNQCRQQRTQANENDSPARHTDRSPYEEFFNSHELKQFEYATTTTSTTTAFESHEKNEFVKDILFDVCSDFDRTFERTKKRHHHDINERNNYASLTKQTEIYGEFMLLAIGFRHDPSD